MLHDATDVFDRRRKQLQQERAERLIREASKKTYQRLASRRCICGKPVCICRGDDWPGAA